MKNIFLLFLMMSILFSSNAQVTWNPAVDNTKEKRLFVSKVQLTPDNTYVYLHISRDYSGGWVIVSPQTRIEYINPQTGLNETKQILRLEK